VRIALSPAGLRLVDAVTARRRGETEQLDHRVGPVMTDS
jgi:hypothetical protein